MLCQFFNHPIAIEAESPELGRQIAALYGEFEQDPARLPQCGFFLKGPGGGGQHEILRNRQCESRHAEERSALMALEESVMQEVMRQAPEMAFIHAAVLARGGRAVLFPGRSGAGKSTLALALAKRNWTYLSDEIAPVEMQDLRVHPFPRGIKLRPEGVGLFPFLRDQASLAGGQRQYLRLRESSLTLAASPHEVSCLIFPEYRPGTRPRLTPLGKGMAASLLARCCLSFNWNNGETLYFLERLVKRADCFRLEVGEIGESCALVENLVGEKLLSQLQSSPAATR